MRKKYLVHVNIHERMQQKLQPDVLSEPSLSLPKDVTHKKLFKNILVSYET